MCNTIAKIDRSKLTPMMQKYLETKEEYKDCILFYRLGDFYEMFFEDAITAAKVLEITLTGKSCGLDERAPMCGIPFHAMDGYLNKLVSNGYKVAICEQVEDPKEAKGLVRREVTRVVTPGTNMSIQALDEKKNQYLMCIVCVDGGFGISVCDVSTGDFHVTQVDDLKKLMDEIALFSPIEIVCNDAFLMWQSEIDVLKERFGMMVYPLDHSYFDEEKDQELLLKHFKAAKLQALGLDDFTLGTLSAGALLAYLYETQKNSLSHITQLHPYSNGKYMLLDSATRRNLELVETMREKNKVGSLLWVLDKTKTAMGARLLRTYVEQPLIYKDDIEARLESVECLKEQYLEREELREYLQPVYDLERLIARITYETANPRDFIAFASSLAMLPSIRMVLEDLDTPLIQEVKEQLDPLEDLCQLIQNAIVEEPPISIRDGGIFRAEYHPDIERLRLAGTKGKEWLAALEEKERIATGIKSMKIKYNRVFGYYLEVTNSYKDMVPKEYIRKQTLANAERYVTEELKELEEDILGAQDKLMNLEYELFVELRNRVAQEVDRIHRTAKAVAKIDVLCSLGFVAAKNNYVRPRINEDGIIHVSQGRHPVVERMMPEHLFITNDIYLDQDKKRISIITGPNMAGKSTYMRQTALIVLMAQIGCFVPANEADISIVDRIFTRVGASDDLASGQSTFMVEMTEVANILRNATPNSLLILDEIGRGTSTFDGLSIAWAVVEHISNPNILGAKTLFATHYHELTELEGRLDNVTNYCIAVKENGDDIVFLRKIIPGGADKSYGILVAKLAGIPDAVIARAKEIAACLDQTDLVKQSDLLANMEQETVQKEIQKPPVYQELFQKIREIDVPRTTPLEAMNVLVKLQEMIDQIMS